MYGGLDPDDITNNCRQCNSDIDDLEKKINSMNKMKTPSQI